MEDSGLGRRRAQYPFEKEARFGIMVGAEMTFGLPHQPGEIRCRHHSHDVSQEPNSGEGRSNATPALVATASAQAITLSTSSPWTSAAARWPAMRSSRLKVPPNLAWRVNTRSAVRARVAASLATPNN